jgi:hypothetical protein
MGKTSLLTAEVLALVTGMPLLGVEGAQAAPGLGLVRGPHG